MDPLSALAVAAAVVQFVDFGSRLLKGARDVYKSPTGQALENIELSVVAHDLSQLVQDAEIKLRNGWTDGMDPAAATSLEASGEVFHRLCRECRETRDALQGAFDKLQVRGNNRVTLATASLVSALRGVFAAGETDKLAERLSQIRQQTMMAVLCLLLGEANKKNMDLRQFAQQQVNMIATLDRIDQTTKKFSTDVVDFIGVGPSQNQSEVDQMVRYVMSDKWNASEYMKQTRLGEEPGPMNDSHAKRILRSLFFVSMGHREAEIPRRYAETFEWIFKEPRFSKDDRPLWSSFPGWLEENCDDIYWITGKPGAGKSTLIKFIARDSRLKQSLKCWAKEAQLLVAHFFSWTAGADKLQKSHEGLLRTLLLETLTQKEELVPRIFPRRWFLLEVFAGKVDLPALELEELMAAFRTLLSATGVSLKLALIIDGLDEFDGDHSQLVTLLREANARTSVKICASSRPWNVFKDEYIRNPMLQLENLTQGDIELFVRKKFDCSPGFREFEVTNPQMARKVLGDVVEKAQGVFLWVSVVSGLLEGSFQDGYQLADLQATIDGLPSQVSELFRYIWNRTSARFRGEASQYFQVVKACDRFSVTPYCLTLWFGDEEASISMKAAEMTSKFQSTVVASIGRRLASRTGGLLEIFNASAGPEESRVGFMHRTASDWVQDNWESIASSTDENFDPCLWILKGEVLRVAPNTASTCFWNSTKILLDVASHVKDNPSNRVTLAEVLDRFDRHIKKVSQFKHPDGSYTLLGDSDYHPKNFAFIGDSGVFPHWCNAPAFTYAKAGWQVATHSSEYVEFFDLAAQIP